MKKEKAKPEKRDLENEIKDAAKEGLELIRSMIRDDDVTDATRLAAAKWAIERAGDLEEKDAEEGAVTVIMQFIRHMKASKALAPAPAPLVEGSETQTEDWSTWIESNLN